jgi:hypothetical protein
MPVDHFLNSTSATFKNRYWVNATYYEAGGPVICVFSDASIRPALLNLNTVFDSGEQNAEPLLPYYLQVIVLTSDRAASISYSANRNTTACPRQCRSQSVTKGSQSFGSTDSTATRSPSLSTYAMLQSAVLCLTCMQEDTTAEQWQYLNTEQALEDVVYFANHFTLSDSGISVHPSDVPWIWLGGSYPGVRGALIRVRNPETIYASWASSAPVQAQIDMAAYYKAAERSLTRNCSADWVAVTKFVFFFVHRVVGKANKSRHVDEVLANGTQNEQTEMKSRLLSARASSPTENATVSGANTSDVDAASILMDPLKFYQVCTAATRELL